MDVIVDDSDSLVHYSSPNRWIHAGKTPEFEATDHGSATKGDTATLEFSGTSISVYGTVVPYSGQSMLNFSIDGGETGSYQTPGLARTSHNLLFWTSPVLEEGSHNLEITVDQDTSLNSNKTIFLDYFVYTTTSNMDKPVLIDDSDIRVTYSPSWQAINDSDLSLQRTNHISASAGSWCSIAFEGTQISLIGGPPQNFKTSVVIDGFQSTVISQSQNQLFSSAVLSPGGHTMNVTLLTGEILGIDYFLVTPAVDIRTTTPVIPSLGLTSSSNLSPTQTPSLASKAVKPTPIGAIIGGGVVGSVVVLALIFLAAFLQRRRARARPNHNEVIVPRMTAVHPFPLSNDETTYPPPYTSKHSSPVRQ